MIRSSLSYILLSIIVVFITSVNANLIVQISDDINNKKYNRDWTLWKFCGCSNATIGGGLLGGLGAVADLWSMGNTSFVDMSYDEEYMPIDPYLVTLNMTYLYTTEFYRTLMEEAVAETYNSTAQMDDSDLQALEDSVYGGEIADANRQVFVDFVWVGWDTVDQEGVFSVITDFKGHLPVHKGDEVCWNGKHLYDVDSSLMKTNRGVMGVGGLELDFFVNDDINHCPDVL